MIKRRLNRIILALECAALTAWYARHIILLLIAAVWVVLFFALDTCRTRGMACIGALLILPLGYDWLLRGRNDNDKK